MEEKGYYIITSNPAPDGSSVEAVENSIGRNRLYGDPLDSGTVGFFDSLTYGENHQELWERVMKTGFNLDINLLKWFDRTQGLLQQGPFVINRLVTRRHKREGEVKSQLRRAHPCPDGISIWRPLGCKVGPENGMFKVYPGSRHIESEEELRESGLPVDEIYLQFNQILITAGGLWIEYSQSCGGILMWMGYSKALVGLHFHSHSLDFLVDAYHAEHLLTDSEDGA